MIVAKAPTTAWRIIEGEAVILSMETKVLRGLNPLGSRVWELIDGKRSMDEIVGQIVREFDVETRQADEDVRRFVQELLDKGLVTPVK
ncbi:MAG: PqqD family protein [Candidatus Rokubacteria bacterium]|nr:PqqD family protein [Candidatus Rokubacteria bacterium]MBI2555359.1 PqqD family protein [Candidatus Rokubacteria bacterium]